MGALLYLLARSGLAFLRLIPLRWVARLGRCVGAMVYLLDARHRRIARANLERCFGAEKTPAEIKAILKENFRRIGENFACAGKTSSMSLSELQGHLSFQPPAPWFAPDVPERLVVAVGHFGNFEIYARMKEVFAGRERATTYRALPNPHINRLLGEIRATSGCQFFERRTDSAALKVFMAKPRTVVGLLADQNAGASGLRLPFLGHDCSTSTAPAVLALRYDCALTTSICYRTGLAQWCIERGSEIPLRQNGAPRPLQDIMTDVNRALEIAVRRDPANWFWVHNRWKARRFRATRGQTATAQESETAEE